MNRAFLPGKLLISMVARHKGEKLVAITKAAGARGGTIAFGRAVADNIILQKLSLADVQQDIVFTLMRDEAPAIITAVCDAYHEKSGKCTGIALLLNVSGMLVRQAPTSETATEPDARREKMDSGYTLLTVIVNNGYADDVMAKARKAGAKGGTILTGRGTASEKDLTFFGLTLVPEKEVLLIVAEKDHVDAILETIHTVPTLAEPGGGIVYTMGVEKFILLGQ